MSDHEELKGQDEVTDEELLRRATELQLEEEQEAEEAVEQADLAAGAAEAGIDPRYLQQAEEELEREARAARARRARLQQTSVRVGAVVVVLLLGTVMMGRGTLRSHYAVVEARQMQLDNVLQRRRDLVPQLTAAAQELTATERRQVEALEAAARQAEGGGNASADEALQAQMDGVLSRLARRPASAAVYARLSDEVAGAENRVAVERKRYNEAVAAYNLAAGGFAARLARPFSGLPARVGQPR